MRPREGIRAGAGGAGVGKTVPAKGNSQAFIEGSRGMVNYFGNLMNKILDESTE